MPRHTSASLGNQIRDTLSPLLHLIRDNGHSVSYLKTRYPARLSSISATPDVTTVRFAHTAIAEYYQRQDDNILVVLELLSLEQCLEAFVNPHTFTTDSEPDDLQANNTFWLYAEEYWRAQLEKVVTLLEDPQLEHIVTEDHSELLRLLNLTLNEEEVLAR